MLKLIPKRQQGGTASLFGGLDFAGLFGGKDWGTGGKNSAKGAQINAGVGAGLEGALQIGANQGAIANSGMSQMQKDGATVSNIADGVSTAALKSGNPYAMAAGAVIKGADMIGNMFMKNNRASKDAKKFNLNDTVASSSSYAGITSDAQEQKGNADSYLKSGMFGKLGIGSGRLRNALRESNIKQNAASGILNQAKMQKDAVAGSVDMFDQNLVNKNFNTGMWNNGSVQFGQQGTKLRDIKTIVKNAKALVKEVPKVEVASFADGGAINVIVDGQLHARKHTLKEDVELLEGANITQKGIPIVTIEKDGGVVQHAEIERDELILNLEVTKKLEKLLEDSSEEAMIKAGKLLAYEIVKNTKDSKSKILKTA